MKRWTILFLLAISCITAQTQNAGINTDGSAPHSSAIFDIKSNSKGLLIPRMSSAERSSISSPAKGLIVFDNETNSFWYFNGTAWVNQLPGWSIPFSAVESTAIDVFSISNFGTGSSVTGRTNAAGVGIRGIAEGNTSGTAIAIMGQSGISGGMGRAGLFQNVNPLNVSNALEVKTNSNGNALNTLSGNAAYFEIDNINATGAAVRAKINTINNTFGSAAVYGETAGTGGAAGVFYASNPSGEGRALFALAQGNGTAAYFRTEGSGDAIESLTTGTGRIGYFRNTNPDNPAHGFVVTSNNNGNPGEYGSGAAGFFEITNAASVAPAVHATVNTPFANFGATAVLGISKGSGGSAGTFYQSNESGEGPALIAIADGNGDGINAVSKKTGHAIEATAHGSGNGIYAHTTITSTGRAAMFSKTSPGSIEAVYIADEGIGSALRVHHKGSSGNILVLQTGAAATGVTVARVNKNGRGFFDDGTQVGGADLAEAFDVTGNRNQYETGDVLVIATGKDRAVEKSTMPYSNLVAGVYATKPGVLLTEEHIDSDISDKVPMGVIGVIPTKVCLEGGAIKRGDMLVTSSQPGVAMKADLNLIKTGQVIGKALQDYEGQGVAKINVLVSVK